VKNNSNTITSYIIKLIKGTSILFYLIFLVALIAGGLSAGIMTLIPNNASKPCYLGYYALCSFAPFSTLILFTMTIVGTFLLINLVKYFKRMSKRVENSTS